MVLGESLKKVLLAGLGTIATTAEKSKEIIEDLVKKGELTVEQGKILNRDLPKIDKDFPKNTLKSIKEKVAKGGDSFENFKKSLDDLSDDKIAELKEYIANLEKKIVPAYEEPVEEAPAEEAEAAVEEVAEAVEEAPAEAEEITEE